MTFDQGCFGPFKCGGPIWLVLAVAQFGADVAAQSLTNISPRFAPPGAQVTLEATGLEEGGDYTVRVGETLANVSSVAADSVQFTVPTDAITGVVALEDAEGMVLEYPWRFAVTRGVSVVIKPGIAATGYGVGSVYGDSESVAAPFDIEVAKGEPSLVVASPGDEDRVLVEIAVDGQETIELSGLSTARTMAFLIPGIYTETMEAAQERLNLLAGYPEIQQAGVLIEANLTSGTNYLDDEAVHALVVAACKRLITEHIAPPIPEEEAAPQRARQRLSEDFIDRPLTFRQGYPRDLTIPRLANLEMLDVVGKETPNDEYGLPRVGFSYEAETQAEVFGLEIKGSPLDWIGHLYDIDHTQFDRLTAVDGLQGSETRVYRRNINQPLQRKLIPSVALGEELKVQDRLGKALRMNVEQDILGLPAADDVQFKLEADRAGLYMTRLFSGAIFEPMEDLVAGLPGGTDEDWHMLVHNTLMSITEFAVIPIKIYNTYAPEELQAGGTEKLLDILQEGTQALLREVALNGVSWQVLFEFVKASFNKMTNQMFKGYATQPLDVLPDIDKMLLGSVDLAVDVAQPINRLVALSNIANVALPGVEAYSAMSVETSIAVVGDPWVPEIAQFEPRSGYRGTDVLITGQNFSPTAGLNLVRFGGLTTDPENPSSGVTAQIIGAPTLTSMRVRVPEDAEDGKNPILIAVAGKGASTTTGNDPPFDGFTIIPDPIIDDLVPEDPRPGGLMRITGRNFHSDLAKNRIEFEVESGQVDLLPLAGSETDLLIRAPNNLFENAVRVVIENRPSNWAEFTPRRPTVFTNPGYSIPVTSALDEDNMGNGSVTLREAILIARGERGWSVRPEGVEDGEYESDHIGIFGGDPPPPPPGIASADRINFPMGNDWVIMLGSELPPIGPGETIDFNSATIDGSALTGDENGLTLDDVSFQVKLYSPKVRNMPGHGILLGAGTHDNDINAGSTFIADDDTQISNCGGDGLRIQGGAFNNMISLISIDNCANGIHLTGEGTAYNNLQRRRLEEFTSGIGPWSLDDNRGYGLLVDNGASFNSLEPPDMTGNDLGGVRVDGDLTQFNLVGPDQEFSVVTHAKIFNSGGPGAWITAPGTTLRNFNIAGNAGDGVLIDGTETILVNRLRVGYGDDDQAEPTANPNLGSGIHVTGGSSGILIGGVSGQGIDYPSFYSRGLYRRQS